jgi:Cft2 family RNA processing exonuclease
MMIKLNNGLDFNGFLIDPHKSPKNHKKVFFTHAHSDHVKLAKEREFYATLATIDLIKKRFVRKYNLDFTTLAFEKKYRINDFDIELSPNGHILGSAQTKIESNEKTTVLTSDFRLQDSLLFKGAKPIECDTLVLETTFGSPNYSFPSYETVLNDLVTFFEKNNDKLIVFAGYSLGKAQELVAIANQAGSSVVVHESIYEMNKIYEKHGISLGKYSKLDHNLEENNVLIMPPGLVDKFLLATLKHFEKREIITAIATGWEWNKSYDYVFPLSNHADYNDLIAYVDASKPKTILTDHGFCTEFARKLNRLGYNAKPLAQNNQQTIMEF